MGHEKYPERNAEIRRRVAAGESQASVARDFGMTRGNVNAICHPVSKKSLWGYGCVYPNIQKWMETNRITWERFGEMADVHFNTLRKALTAGLDLRKTSIDGVLTATGLTYEQAFAKEAKA